MIAAMLSVREPRLRDRIARLPLAWGEDGLAERTIVVERDGEAVAAALGRDGPTGPRIDALRLGDVAAPAVLHALAGAFGRVELLTRDEAGAAAARDAGWRLVLRQTLYAGPLAAARPARRRFTFRPAVHTGRRGLLAALQAVWGGDAGPTGKAHADELDDLLCQCDGEASLWRLAYHRDAFAGVVLPQLDGRGTGTLLYLGLAPAARGRGLGRALHAEALWQLRQAGACRYEDATEADNLPMRALLAAAGCEPAGFVELHASASAPRHAANAPRLAPSPAPLLGLCPMSARRRLTTPKTCA